MKRLAILALLLPGLARAACPPVPPAAAAPDEALPSARQGGTLSLLVVGSASTAAPGGYPQALAAALRAARPGLRLRLDLRGGGGEDAAQGLARLRQALGGGHYDEVLWQLGTVDAVLGARPEDFADSVDAGIAAARAHGAAVVLIDPQFSRFLRANVDLAPYESVLEAAALEPGVVLFPRLAVTTLWAEADGLDPGHVPAAMAASVARRVQVCVGRALARFLLAAPGG